MRLAAKLTGWKIDIKSETDARELGIYPSATSTFIPADDAESDFDDVAVDLYQDDEE